MVAEQDPQPVDWSARVDALRRRAETMPRDIPRADWFPELDGDELVPGPDLTAALERSWSSVCPERFVNARLAPLDAHLRSTLSAYVQRPDGRTLAIAGGVGTGKTHAALAVGHALHMASREVRFWGVVKLWRQLRPGGPEGLIDAVCDVDVLIVDDLGSERATDWSAEQLWEIVDHRWTERRATIFTTNASWAALRESVGDRVYDRLMNAETVRVVLDGGSRRRT